jgi:hypothetical protein
MNRAFRGLLHTRHLQAADLVLVVPGNHDVRRLGARLRLMRMVVLLSLA